MVKLLNPKELLAPALSPRITGFSRCSYCKTGNHEYCPRVVLGNGPRDKAKMWKCDCDDPNCNTGVLRCTDCKTETPGEVNPITWACFDLDICAARVATRLSNNPTIQLLRDIKGRQDMARATKTAAPAKKATAKRAVSAPRTGVCLVTGQVTKGGKFLPGMDARYVSQRVQEVIDKQVTVTDQRKRLKADEVSDALVAKFEKSLALKRDAQAAERQAGTAKKAPAKKATPRKRAAAKPEPEPEDVDADLEYDEDDEDGDDGF